jgi:putative phosphoribosyl transferase
MLSAVPAFALRPGGCGDSGGTIGARGRNVAFDDRTDAGRQLAARLEHLRGQQLVVLGLPRGGVPVAREIARVLGAPLDVIVVRKLGVPFQPELGMGAVGEDGVRVINREVLIYADISPDELAAVEHKEQAEVLRRAARYRGGRPRIPLEGKVAVIVDDGVATGSTARAACGIARALGAERVVLAVPVAPPDWQDRLGQDADELVSVATPEPFFAIGQFYTDFSATSDEEVIGSLADSADSQHSALDRETGTPGLDEEVDVDAGPVHLPGHLTVPGSATGIVVFAHGSGSSRHSRRNSYVAGLLTRAGLGVLLFDLLTPAEEANRENVFDIDLLAGRLTAATAWLRGQIGAQPTGYFGASTGAAAALLAAAQPDAEVAAVVSRGGRPDLARPHLPDVRAPTLLIVGGADEPVLSLNRQAQRELRCENDLAVVDGATHLFEEPGALATAAELARDWFTRHFAA